MIKQTLPDYIMDYVCALKAQDRYDKVTLDFIRRMERVCSLVAATARLDIQAAICGFAGMSCFVWRHFLNIQTVN